MLVVSDTLYVNALVSPMNWGNTQGGVLEANQMFFEPMDVQAAAADAGDDLEVTNWLSLSSSCCMI